MPPQRACPGTMVVHIRHGMAMSGQASPLAVVQVPGCLRALLLALVAGKDQHDFQMGGAWEHVDSTP